jgi:hypothetical protein
MVLEMACLNAGLSSHEITVTNQIHDPQAQVNLQQPGAHRNKRGRLLFPLRKPSKRAHFGWTCLKPTSNAKHKLTKDVQWPLNFETVFLGPLVPL